MDSGSIDWTVISVGLALAGLILVTTQRMRADMKALEERLNKRLDEKIDGLAARQDEKIDSLSERLGRVEEGQVQLSERLGRQDQEQARMNGVLETLPERLGRLDQEQARMNGMLETIRTGLSYRVERTDAGDRVAEDAESYEPEG